MIEVFSIGDEVTNGRITGRVIDLTPIESTHQVATVHWSDDIVTYANLENLTLTK